jgi:hypothetical protein
MIFRETLITPLVQIQQAQVIYTLDRASSEGHARKTTKRVSASDDGSILFAAEPGQRHHRFKPLVSLDKRVLIAGVTGHEMFQQKKNSIYMRHRPTTLPRRQRYSCTSHIMMYTDKLPGSITQPHKIQIYWSS